MANPETFRPAAAVRLAPRLQQGVVLQLLGLTERLVARRRFVFRLVNDDGSNQPRSARERCRRVAAAGRGGDARSSQAGSTSVGARPSSGRKMPGSHSASSDQPGLDQDATEVAVEHGDVQGLKRLSGVGKGVRRVRRTPASSRSLGRLVRRAGKARRCPLIQRRALSLRGELDLPPPPAGRS